MSQLGVILQESLHREREGRTILGLLTEQMESANNNREPRRRRSLKERLRFTGMGCCGATWGFRPTTVRHEGEEEEEEDERRQQQQRLQEANPGQGSSSSDPDCVSPTDSMDASTSSQSLSFYGFLDRMRNPASLNLVRSIKSFIVSFSFYPPNPENDGKRVQDFYLTMEAAIREHPLWTGATEEEIDCAMEGLEKYIMTKLFSRTFGVSPEDAKIDHEISEKICLVQTFLKPEHLDIPAILHNEASWLLAEKELQKINTFKAPREKLSSIMNCCRVINNLLLNAAMSENHVPAGADDFLPVLIYVTIKASSPWPILLSCNQTSNSSSCTEGK